MARALRIEFPGAVIIDRFSQTGVLEDVVFEVSEQGTPQCGLVSPVLANIYLHYVLDVWFEKRYARSCGGKAFLCATPMTVCHEGSSSCLWIG